MSRPANALFVAAGVASWVHLKSLLLDYVRRPDCPAFDTGLPAADEIERLRPLLDLKQETAVTAWLLNELARHAISVAVERPAGRMAAPSTKASVVADSVIILNWMRTVAVYAVDVAGRQIAITSATGQ